MSFIFGGNTGQTYEDIQRKKKLAEALMMQNQTPRNVGEGIHAIGKALAGRAMERRASRAEDKMRGEFEERFGQVAPQGRAMVDLYNNPMASEGHKKILGALMAKGVPGFSRGGIKRKQGLAVVGEAGPELVELPAGAKIDPLIQDLGEGYDPGYEAPMMQGGKYVRPIPLGENPEDDAYFREELGEELFQRYQSLTPGERIQFLNDPANGFVAPVDDPAMDREMEMLQPMSRFDDANLYQVADSGQIQSDAQPSFSERAREAGLDMNVTQAQRTGQALRLLQAESVLRNLESQGTRTGQRAIEVLPDGIENLLIDEDYGRFKQARDAFAEAAMRADTGATINESEWPRIINNLMPQPGDGPERLAQRRAMREVFIQSLMASSGEAGAIMPKIGEPVVPIEAADPSKMSDEELLKALGQ